MWLSIYKVASGLTKWRLVLLLSKGEILSAKMQSYNSFDAPETVKKQNFDQFTVKDNRVLFTIPAHSVMQIRVK